MENKEPTTEATIDQRLGKTYSNAEGIYPDNQKVFDIEMNVMEIINAKGELLLEHQILDELTYRGTGFKHLCSTGNGPCHTLSAVGVDNAGNQIESLLHTDELDLDHKNTMESWMREQGAVSMHFGLYGGTEKSQADEGVEEFLETFPEFYDGILNREYTIGGHKETDICDVFVKDDQTVFIKQVDPDMKPKVDITIDFINHRTTMQPSPAQNRQRTQAQQTFTETTEEENPQNIKKNF